MSSSSDSKARRRGLRAGIVSAAAVLGGSVLLSASASVWADSDQSHQTVDPDAPAMATAVVNSSGEQIAYDVVDGMAVVENDIILGSHAEVQQDGIDGMEMAPAEQCPEGLQCGVIDTSQNRRWPGGVIPFALIQGTSNSAAEQIALAIQEWESKTSVRFVPRTNENDFVVFQGTGNGNTCSSFLGRSGGAQPINYSGNGRGCLVHEIGHAVGLNHEHNRNDRDDHINIDFSNVAGNAASQFRIASGSTDVGPYDLGSVMHYSAFAFALNPSQPVITPKDPTIPLSAVGGREVLTESDVLAVEFVYGDGNPEPPPPPPPPTTTTAPPTTTTEPTTPPTEPTTPPTEPTTPPTEPTTPPTEPTPPTSEPSTTTTTPASTTSSPAPPTTEPPPPPPGGDQRAVVEFLTLTDGGTIASDLPSGVVISAFDPDAGTEIGDGIRLVTLVLTDGETGRFLAAGRDRTAPYDWGVRLQSGRSYTFTAFAVSSRSAGGRWSRASVTVTAE